MISYIRQLERGGLMAFGACLYDEQRDAIVFHGQADEVRPVTLSMDEDIDSIDVDSGASLTVSTPTIDGDTASFTLGGLEAEGFTDLIVTLDSGAVQRVRLISQPMRRIVAVGDYWRGAA